MKICAAVFDIQIPSSSSLKDKRKQIKGLIDSFRSNFNVSASEVAYHDKWQRAAVGVVWISMSSPKDDSFFSTLENQILSRDELLLLGVERCDY